MTELRGSPLVCVRCRVPPNATVLDDAATCRDCGAVYAGLTDAVPAIVAAALEDEILRRDVPGPLPSADEGALAAWLAGLVPGTASFGQVARAAASCGAFGDEDGFHERLCAALVPEAARPGRAVDLGCGVGALSFALARRGWDVTGVDLDAHALRWAERARNAPAAVVDLPARRDAGSFVVRAATLPAGRERTRFVAANLLDPPFAAASFDLVALVNVLDVVRHPAVALQQAVALLAPGAILLVATPDAWAEPAVPRAQWLATDEAGWDRVFAAAGLETVARVDDVEWSLVDTPRMRHVYRVHGRLLRRAAKGESR